MIQRSFQGCNQANNSQKSTSNITATWQALVESIIAGGVPSSIAPLTDATVNNTEACLHLLQQTFVVEACMKVGTNLSNLEVLLCTRHGNSSGTVLVYDLEARLGRSNGDNASNTAHNIYRVRLSGPEVTQPVFQYCGRVAAAQFELTIPGNYHLELLQLYKDFSYGSPPQLMIDVHAAHHHLRVPSGATRPLHSCVDTTSKLDSKDSTCPTCRGFGHNGRWVVAPQADKHLLQGVQEALQYTCVFKPMHNPFFGCPLALLNASVNTIRQQPLLHWLPYGCRYHPVTAAFATKCKVVLQARAAQQLPGRRVCFIGDSQTRHLYNQVVHLMGGAPVSLRKEVLKSEYMMFQREFFGNGFLSTDTRNCSHVFINFGQWPVSYQVARPWSAQRYMKAVQKLALHIQKQQQQHGNKHYWVTTGPMPLSAIHQEKIYSALDHRTDPFLLLFNKIASTTMHAHGIPVVDTYSIASPLFDMSYDGSHYVGTVGLEQAAMIMNIFCQDLLQPAGGG